MNGEAIEYIVEDSVMLRITRTGKRSRAGNLEFGGGDKAGRVAGGAEEDAVFEALRLVLAMLLSCTPKV